jgi:rare lipoprotein A
MRLFARSAAAVGVAALAAACASTPPVHAPTPRPQADARRSAPPAALPSRPRSYAEAWGGKSQSKPAPDRKRAQITPRQGVYKVGPPYQVRGTWYVPAEQPDYVDVGLASWYGDEFHGRPTANGEVFDAGLVTGAHTTLPLPSLVEVTNLDNGKTVKVRLNDRGPFSHGRIIDLSRAAAEALDFRAEGTAKVRVRYLGRADDGMTIAAREPARRGPLQMPGLSISPRDDGGWAVQAGAFSQAGPGRSGRGCAEARGPHLGQAAGA